MGTTIVAALVLDNLLSIAHVGDSRMYCSSNSELLQLTRDDSWAARVLVQPAAAASAEPHPMRNVLTNVLGARDSTDIHIQERPSRLATSSCCAPTDCMARSTTRRFNQC